MKIILHGAVEFHIKLEKIHFTFKPELLIFHEGSINDSGWKYQLYSPYYFQKPTEQNAAY